MAYSKLKHQNDVYNKCLMLISSVGALVSSILALAGLNGWPYEVIPISLQATAGLVAGWMRFRDFPKRMEQIINAKHTANVIREELTKNQTIDEQRWASLCAVDSLIDAVLTPLEREKAVSRALSIRKIQSKRNLKLFNMVSQERNRDGEVFVVTDSEMSMVEEEIPLPETPSSIVDEFPVGGG